MDRSVILALPVLLGACSGMPVRSVESVIRGLIQADNASDIDRIAAFYAEDAVLMPPEGAPVHGRKEIRERYRRGFERFKLSVELRSEETRVAGDWAFDRGVTKGHYVWHDGREPTAFEDKYVMILKQTADGWRVAVLMWSPTS